MTSTANAAVRRSQPDQATPQARRVLRMWLFVVAALIFAMIMLGGATRLTNSGLSMTEWKPVVNLIPPLTENAWRDAFEKYKQIPQYKLINRDMSLAGYKAIYWWEWSHRELGMTIGASFFLPLMWFWWRGMIGRALMPRLLLIFAAGGAQGGLGWFMVASGLSVRTDVSQYRLTAHLGAGVLLLGAVLWMAFSLLPAREAGAAPLARGVRWGAFALVWVIFLQILAGGFTAGTDAGLSHNTWPLIDGALVPSGLWTMQPWYLNLFENVLTIQFNHRMLGYLAGGLAMVHAVSVWRRLGAGPARASAGLLAVGVLVQIVLGVAVLLSVVQIGLALAHQAVAVTLFALALYHLHAVR